MSIMMLDESVMAKSSKSSKKKSSSSSSKSKSKSKSKSSKSSKDKSSKPSSSVSYYPGTPIFIWTTGADGVSYQSTSDLCPVQYCTVEGDDGLERCGTTEECEDAMSSGSLAIVVSCIVGALLLAIVVKLMWGKPCKKCIKKIKKAGKSGDSSSDTSVDQGQEEHFIQAKE